MLGELATFFYLEDFCLYSTFFFISLFSENDCFMAFFLEHINNYRHFLEIHILQMLIPFIRLVFHISPWLPADVLVAL